MLYFLRSSLMKGFFKSRQHHLMIQSTAMARFRRKFLTWPKKPTGASLLCCFNILLLFFFHKYKLITRLPGKYHITLAKSLRKQLL